jgi:sodium/hydrogen antiporter
MALVLAFGVVLLVSVSLSGVAARTVRSIGLLFLLAGAPLPPYHVTPAGTVTVL